MLLVRALLSHVTLCFVAQMCLIIVCNVVYHDISHILWRVISVQVTPNHNALEHPHTLFTAKAMHNAIHMVSAKSAIGTRGSRCILPFREEARFR